jgi:hypothetical protein
MVAADVVYVQTDFIYFIVSGMPALKTGYSRLLVVITSVVIGTHLFPLDQIFSTHTVISIFSSLDYVLYLVLLSLHPAHDIEFWETLIKTRLGLLAERWCSATLMEPKKTQMYPWSNGTRALADPQARFQNILDYIVRKDATVLVTGDAVQPRRWKMTTIMIVRCRTFTKRVDVVLRAIEVNRAIALFERVWKSKLKTKRR